MLIGGIVGWYFCGDYVRESIDREMVRNVRYDPSRTDLKPGARPGSRNRLILSPARRSELNALLTADVAPVRPTKTEGEQAGASNGG